MAALTDRPVEKSSKTLEGQFDPNNPSDWQRYWVQEFAASRKQGGEDWTGIQAFQDRGNRIVKRYRASKKGSNRPNDARLNLFPANVQTQRAILIGQAPRCDVTRRYEDQADDDARVAALILERILNTGIEDESHGMTAVMNQCTEDRLLPGMCGSRVQFSAEIEQVPEQPAIMGPCPACHGSGWTAAAPAMPQMPPTVDATPPPVGEPQRCPQCQGAGQVERAPAKPAQEKPTNEEADVVYVNWRDQLWSVARTWDEVRWWAFSAEMSRKQLKELFGEEEGAAIPIATGKKSAGRDAARKESPWARATVWEIHSKEHNRWFWYVEGHSRVIFPVDNPEGQDPLGLDGFWDFPRPMMANATTDAYLPTADFDYAKDLYDEADELTSRIRGIVRAIKVVGAYDKANGGLKRILDEACELEMIPVKNFAEFLTKGGLKGVMDLLPIQEMVQTVLALSQQRNQVIADIYQITGMSDIIRGQQQAAETATTSAIKARYASVRLQDMQKEVARYATDLQRIRKEIIAKHWSIETIIERSSILQSEDGQSPEGQQRVLRAAKLIKDRHLDFRVAIKPEQISLQDWAQLKQQRAEVLTALGSYFQSMMPLVQLITAAGPMAAKATLAMVVRNAQFLVAGMPGASAVEVSLDTFIADLEKVVQQAAAQAQQPQPPKPPDPKVQSAQIKAKGDIAKTQAATQGRLVEIGAEARAGMAQREHDAKMDVLTDQAKSEARLRLDAMRAVDTVTGGMAR